jgi:hypothetical protein
LGRKKCGISTTSVFFVQNLLDADHTCFFRPAKFLKEKTSVISALQMLEGKNV